MKPYQIDERTSMENLIAIAKGKLPVDNSTWVRAVRELRNRGYNEELPAREDIKTVVKNSSSRKGREEGKRELPANSPNDISPCAPQSQTNWGGEYDEIQSKAGENQQGVVIVDVKVPFSSVFRICLHVVVSFFLLGILFIILKLVFLNALLYSVNS